MTLLNESQRGLKLRYKVAIVKIDARVLGASGITHVRVGFPGARPQMALEPGMEGCLALAAPSGTDFYPLINPITQKKDERFAGELERFTKMARTISDPVGALKAKDLGDRFDAAVILLRRYLAPYGGYSVPDGLNPQRESIPDEENKLILALLAELPWKPPGGNYNRPDGGLVPHREALGWEIIAGEFGFRHPRMSRQQLDDPAVTIDTLMDEATTRFLKENTDAIKLKRFVQK